MINVGCVSTFKDPKADKSQALKIIEEAAEVFGAMQEYEAEVSLGSDDHEYSVYQIKKECADVIQATCNLLAGIGVKDFTSFMADCRIDNEYRGRIYEDTIIKEPEKKPKEQLMLV